MSTPATPAPKEPRKDHGSRRGHTPDIEVMKAQYERMGVRGVAEVNNVSYGKALSMLHEAGVTLRPRGGGGGRRRSYTDEEAARWRAEYDADETLRVADLAEKHHRKFSTMRNALELAGGPLRDSSTTRANRRVTGQRTRGAR